MHRWRQRTERATHTDAIACLHALGDTVSHRDAEAHGDADFIGAELPDVVLAP